MSAAALAFAGAGATPSTVAWISVDPLPCSGVVTPNAWYAGTRCHRDLHITFRETLEGIQPNVYADVLWGAYYELFADFFQALALSEDFDNPIFEAFEAGYWPNGSYPLSRYNMFGNDSHYRNFNATNTALEQIDSWSATKDHFVYAPVRAHLGAVLQRGELTDARRNQLLRALLAALEADLAWRLDNDDEDELLTTSIHGATLNHERIGQLNRELIERFDSELAASGSPPVDR